MLFFQYYKRDVSRPITVRRCGIVDTRSSLPVSGSAYLLTFEAKTRRFRLFISENFQGYRVEQCALTCGTRSYKNCIDFMFFVLFSSYETAKIYKVTENIDDILEVATVATVCQAAVHYLKCFKSLSGRLPCKIIIQNTTMPFLFENVVVVNGSSEVC